MWNSIQSSNLLPAAWWSTFSSEWRERSTRFPLLHSSSVLDKLKYSGDDGAHPPWAPAPPSDSAQPNNLQAIRIKTRLKTWSQNKECANKVNSPLFSFPPLLSSFSLKLHILVSSTGVRLNIDCQEVAEKEIKAAGNTSSDGYQVLGKMSKSIGSKGESATVSQLRSDLKCLNCV